MTFYNVLHWNYWVSSSYPVTIAENIAMLVGMGIFIVLNFIGQKFFVFKKKVQ